MKKIILLSALAASVCFSQCKKKKDDPAPAAATTTTTTTTTGTNTTGTNTTGTNTTGTNTTGTNTTGTTTTAPTTPSGSLTIGGVTQSFDVSVMTPNGFYVIFGQSSKGTYSEFDAGFIQGSPVSKSVDLSTGEDPYLTFSNSSVGYDAISGTAKVTVNGASVTVEFTNAVFKSDNGSGNITASGKLVAINK